MKNSIFLILIIVVCSLSSFPQTTTKAEISAKRDDYFAPTFTAKEISRRVLKLIKSINGLDKISPKNLEKVIGGDVKFNGNDRNNYGYAGKIAGSEWFYQIFSLTQINGETARRLEFSFEKNDDNEQDLTPVCGFSYEDYKKELSKMRFTVTPYYGEHGRFLYWHFEKNSVQVDIKTYKNNSKECVKTIWIQIL